MKDVATYVHALDGRLRIKVPEVKGAPHKARQIEQQFRPLGPIDHVGANPVTGNVLVLYDPTMTSAPEIVDAMRAVGYLAGGGVPEVGESHPRNVLLRATTEFALQKLITALI